MTWASSVIPAAEQALFAIDKPVLVAQALPVVSTVEWNASGIYGADASAANYPARRAHDGLVEVWTKPASAQTAWYLMMKSTTGMEIDTLAGLGHILGTIGSVVSSLEIADNDAFDLNLAELWSATPASDDRFAVWSLKHTGSDPRRYTGVTRARFKMTKGAAFTPQFCELLLGRRYQLTTKPIYGWDDSQLQDISEQAEDQGGAGEEVIYSENQFVLDATWKLYDSAEIATAKAAWKAIKRGFIFCNNPTSAPQGWQFMRRTENKRFMPNESYPERTFTLRAVERGPDQYFLENE